MEFYNHRTSNFIYAIDSENSTLLKKLLADKSPLEMESEEWYNLVLKAIRIQNFDAINLLLWDFHVNNNNKHPSRTPLHTAVLKNDVTLIPTLLNEGADIDGKDQFGNTPLYLAVENKNFDAVRALVNRGADFNMKNNLNVTPLSLAVYIGNIEIFDFLLNRGANVNTACTIINDLGDYTPLHLAAVNDGHNGKRMIERLLEKGAEINAVEKNGLTALHLAISKGRYSIIEYLLEYTDINVENEYRISPLCIAAALGDFKTVNGLINHKAHVNINCDYDNYSKSFTPLHLAARNGNKETVELLIKGGANLEARNANGETALHISINKKHTEVIQVLINYGADVNSVSGNQEMKSPLYQAIVTYNEEIIKLLISGGVFINSPINVTGTLPIHFAAKNGNGTIMKILLDNGIYVDTLDKDGKTPLFIAYNAKKSPSVECILKYCPNLKYQSNKGLFNNIYHDDEFEYKKALQIFFKHGVTMKRENVNNKLLICTAIETGYVNVVEQLLELGVNPNTILDNDSMYSMLHVACQSNNEKIVKVLINKGADVNCRDNRGKTPLFHAIAHDNMNIIELLLHNYADANAKTQDGRTPLHIAVSDLNVDVIELLLNNGADINCNIEFALDVDDDEDSDEDREYSDYDAFIDANYERQYEYENRCEVAEVLKKHIIKLKAINLFVSIGYLRLANDEWGLTAECEKEIKNMKNHRVHNDISHITFYNILIKNVHTVAIYLENKKIKTAIKNCNIKEMYPFYFNMLTFQYQQAMQRNRLFESESGIQIFKIFSTLPYVCVDEVFSYLGNASLQILVLAIEAVGDQDIHINEENNFSDFQKITCDLPNKKIRR